MKIKTNKTNKTNMGKRNNTRKTNNKGRTYRRGGQVKPRVRGATVNLGQPPPAPIPATREPIRSYPPRQGKQNRTPREPYVGLIPESQLRGMVNWLKKSTELSICAEVNKLIPAFQNTPDVPIKLPEPVAIMGNGAKQYIIGTESYFIKTAEEADQLINKLQAESAAIRIERSRITCATLLLLGMISYRLQNTGNKFIIVAKGGLGVALVSFNKLVSVSDLDFKVVKNPQFQGEYNQIEGMHLALYICYLIQSVLQQIVSEKYSIEVLDPTTRRKVGGYQDMVKISLRAPNKMLFPFLDIDFGDYEKNKHYFEHMRRTILKSIPIGGRVSFVYQNVKLMLEEKLYYYAQYLFLRDHLANIKYVEHIKSNPDIIATLPAEVTNPSVYSNFTFGQVAYEAPSKEHPNGVMEFNGEPITIEECARFIEKFKRSIYIITDAIIEVMKPHRSDLSLNYSSRRNTVSYFILKIPELAPRPGAPSETPLGYRVLNSLYPQTKPGAQ